VKPPLPFASDADATTTKDALLAQTDTSVPASTTDTAPCYPNVPTSNEALPVTLASQFEFKFSTSPLFATPAPPAYSNFREYKPKTSSPFR
jgi:hypothetical protein